MATPDVYFKIAAAAVSFTCALLVFIGGPRRPANQFLAFFLLLIAWNQEMEVFRGLAATATDQVFWFRLATVAAALDPFFLYYFVSIYPQRNSLNDRWKVGLVFAGGAALTLIAMGQDPPGRLFWFELVLAAYTAIVYTAALVQAMRALKEPAEEGALPLLFLALSLAAIPVWGRVGVAGTVTFFRDLAPFMGAPAQPLWTNSLFATLAILAATAALLAFATRLRTSPATRRMLTRGILAGGALGIVLRLGTYSTYFNTLDLPPLLAALWNQTWITFVSASGAAVRWLIIEALVVTAVLRFRMLGMSLARRRFIARALVAGLLAGATILLAFTLQSLFPEAAYMGTLVLLGVLVVVAATSDRLRALMDRTAATLYGVPMAGDRAAALDAYRTALAESLEEGRTPASDERLARLRDELGIAPEDASVLERMAASAERGPLTAGRLVAGRYRITRFLGRGGSGRAFLARDERTLSDVVVKEILHDDRAGEAAATREARLALRLRHPHLVAGLDHVQRPGVTLLVTEYLPGGSLAERVRREGPLPVADALTLMDGVLAGLEALHANGITHRDLTPGNVLLTLDGTPKVGDFGLARGRPGGTVAFDAPPGIAGTPDFMAPEQRRGEPATPATDVYAAARLLQAISAGPLPPAVADVVEHALNEDAAARPPNAAAFREALAAARPALTT